MNGFIEISDGLWYEIATGLPWSSKKLLGRGKGWATDGELKLLKSKNTGGYYVVKINRKVKLWHRLVYEHFNGPLSPGIDVDHINNKREDNRESNLQLLSHKSNSRYSLKSKRNTSGFAGVTWHKRDKKWQAQITINCKRKHLGHFDSIEEAHEAYLQAKIKYHGKESIRAL